MASATDPMKYETVSVPMMSGPRTVHSSLNAAHGDGEMKTLPRKSTNCGPKVSTIIAATSAAIASFAGRRAYASASVIGFFLLVPAAATVLRNLATGETKRYLILAHPIQVIIGFGNWIFHIQAKLRTQVGRAELPGSYYFAVMLAVIAVATTVLLLRYRRNEA